MSDRSTTLMHVTSCTNPLLILERHMLDRGAGEGGVTHDIVDMKERLS